MSEETLLNVIKKLSELSSILVNSNKIEKSLEELQETQDRSNLDRVIEETKDLVDNVYSCVSDIKAKFYDEFGSSKESEKEQNNSENSNSEPKQCDTSELNSKKTQDEDHPLSGNESEDGNTAYILEVPIDSITENNLPDELTNKTPNTEDTEKSNSLESTVNEKETPDVKTEDSSTKPNKPVIKLVDINKLVDPTITTKTPENCNSSVIILTSSDEETTKKSSKQKSKNGAVESKQSLRKSRRKNTRTRNHNSDSVELVECPDSDDSTTDAVKKNGKKVSSSSDDEPAQSKPKWLKKLNSTFKDTSDDNSKDTQSSNDSSDRGKNREDKESKHRKKGGSKTSSSDEANKRPSKKQRFDPLEQISLLDTSDSESDNIQEESTSEHKKKYYSTKYKNNKKTQNCLSKECTSELYIPLPRIPTEKLKETYLKNKELLEIKRLTNMKSLKTKRFHLEEGSPPSKETKREKSCPKSKKKKPQSDSEKESDTEMSNDIETNPTETAVLSSDVSCTEDMVETILNNLDANDQDPMRLSDEEKEETDVQEKSNKKKSEDGLEKNTDKQKEDHADDVDNQEDKASSDEDNEKKKEKGKWKRDKLLTEKLSSSDSDAELKKAKKRLEKSKEGESSDSDAAITPKPKIKSKRTTKKRAKVVIDSDDSDANNKSSGDEFQSKDKSSSDSSESEKEKEEEPEKPKPKRKRIKKTNESSSDDENKSTRKQIRKVISRDDLSDTTKKAEADEKERKARILEKQKKYNMIFESLNLNATVEKVVLDFNEETEEEVLKVDEKLAKKLKPHQASGIKFMWDACYESIERAKKTKGSGCILAHCMGLGKTLQVIALAHTLLTNNEKTGVERVMVVCPVNTVLNWKSEFKKWLKNDDDFEVYELVSCKQNYERQYQITDWYKSGGVLIIGYNMFRTISNPNNKKLSKKMRNAFHEGLVDPGPDLVVCDEGHLLKNEKSNLNIAMNRIKTLRRIVLTGTPLQNNLREYWCMVQFVKPNLLGTYKEYLNRFVNPITNGQYTDSTPHDIQIMRKRAHVLHKMLDGVVQRKDYAVLQPYLPPKHEYVLFVSLSEVQIKIYEHYMANFARKNDNSNRTSFLFTDFQQLQRICTHPRVLLDKSIEDREKRDKLDDDEESEGSLKDFIDDGSENESNSSKSSDKSGSGSGSESDTGPARKRMTRATRAQRRENNEPDSDIEEEAEKKEWWQEFCDGEELDNINNSGKMFLLFEILKECEQIGDKILIFSQSLYTLNCIEYFLNKIDEATQIGNTETVGGHSGSWSIGLDYFRLDGSSSCDNRASWCDSFNSPSNTRARLFLISTKAGGLGINLTAANRVIIFDVSWNPSHDTQSIYRVYRFGQIKPSYVYRFVAYGTMEMKVYERQVTKQAISKRVIDEQQIDRHYNQNDLQELYKCDLHPSDRPIPLVPKDVLLGEMLHTYDKHIYKYHEHQSLLENKEEETLNEEERKAAWEEFENEKTNRYNYNSGSAGYSTQTIALALTSIVRKDNPTWNDTQIKGIIPALVQQLQVQMQGGDLSMYMRVQNEIKLMQQAQAQKFREQFYQQQVLRMIQQQQQQASLMGNLSIDPTQLYNLLGGSGGSRNTTSSSNDVIELN